MPKWLRSLAHWFRAVEEALDYDPHAHLFERVRQMESRLRAVEAAVSETTKRGPI